MDSQPGIPRGTDGHALPPPCPSGVVDTLPPKYWARYWRLFPNGDQPSWKAFPKEEREARWKELS